VPDPLRLLIVTGSPDDASLVLEALRKTGLPFEAASCRRFDEGLDALRQESFDVVLLDPGRDPGAAARVSGQTPGIPVILLVSRDDLDLAVRALWRGADDYLVREEITPELLACTLRHALALKRAEAALGRVEGMWREIGGSLHEGVLVVDRGGVIMFASARMAEILGYPAGELPGTSFLSFVDQDDAPRAAALIGRWSEDGRKEAELRLRRSDGEAVAARVAASPVTAGGEEHPGMAIGVADITGQKTAEEKVRRRNAQLDAINQVVRTAAASADMDELLAGVLEKTLELLGFEGGGVYLIDPGRSRAELVAETGLPEGDSLRQRIVDLDTPPYDAVIGQGIPHFVEDYPEGAGDGIRAFASIPITAEGKVIGAVNLASRSPHIFSPAERDLLTSISQEIGSAVERMRLREGLEKAHEQANFYLDLLTHDINNANTAAIGYAMLLREMLSGPEKNLAGKLTAAVRQSAEIIRNVSAIRRIAQESLVPRPVDLDAVIQNVICLFPDADIVYEPQGRWVAADDLLSEVFINLVGNAAKFGGPGVSIRISTREEDGTVAVSVEDTGPGIPDAEKPRVFEKFRKGGAKSGKGIGLYIVRVLIERYGGRIRVEDRVPGHPESGAAFRFTLPACLPITGRTG